MIHIAKTAKSTVADYSKPSKMATLANPLSSSLILIPDSLDIGNKTNTVERFEKSFPDKSTPPSLWMVSSFWKPAMH